jgi:hypothetical protein
MEMYFTLLLTVLLLATWTMLYLQQVEHRQSMKSLQEEHTKQVKLLVVLNEKAQALVASSDPLAFQQIQAMSLPTGYDGYQDYDPSDEAEAARILDRNPNLAAEGEVNAEETRALLAELTGIDPEFNSN